MIPSRVLHWFNVFIRHINAVYKEFGTFYGDLPSLRKLGENSLIFYLFLVENVPKTRRFRTEFHRSLKKKLRHNIPYTVT